MHKLLLSIVLIAFLPILSFSQKTKKNKIPKEIVKSIPLLTTYLTKSCTSEKEKVDTIYSWITHNIAYNYKVLESTKPLQFQSPKDVLKSKKAVCSGYVYLMLAMLKEANIQSEYIEGYTRPNEMDTNYTVLDANHAWIAINIDGKWELADPTWDAGYCGRIPKKEMVLPKRFSKEKNFKWSFRNKIRKKRILRKVENFEKKKEKRDPYTNKFGFVFNPSKDWYLIDKDSFLLSHLPTLPQWQLKSRTITVNQFCDKSEKLPENFANPKGDKIEFEILNDEYIAKNLLDKWLYTAEKGHAYNEFNFGVKAIHYHNFIGALTDDDFKKSMSHLPLEHSLPIYETLMNMSDTVLIYGKLAIDTEKSSYKENKKDFAEKFKVNELADKNHIKELQKLDKNIIKIEGLISKSEERNDKEIKAVEKKIEEIATKYPTIENEIKLNEADKLVLKSLFKSIDSLNNKVTNFYTNYYALVDTTVLERLFEEASYSEYYLRTNEQYLSFNTMEYNKTIIEFDSLAQASISQLNKIVMDSLIKEIPSKDPYTDIKAIDQLIKKYKPILKTMEAEKKITNASNIEFYMNAVYFQLLKKNYEYNAFSNQYFRFLSTNIKNYDIENGKIYDAIDAVEKAKSKFKKQLSEELDKGNKRMINLYTMTMKNAKVWKAIFKAKLK